MPKGASLLPQDFAVGGVIPDGDYTILKSETDIFNYPGTSESAPTLKITYQDGEGTEYSQHYSAGKLEFLIPSDDKARFIHPSGGDAKISKSSNLAMFLEALLKGGFPTAGLTDDVTAFAGHRVTIENKAQPKRPGLKDADAKEKSIPLPVKYLGEAKGAAGAGGRRGTGTQTMAAKPASSTTAHGTNGAAAGEVDGKATDTLLKLLLENGGSMARMKASTQAMLLLSKDKDPDVIPVKKLIGDAEWLKSHAKDGGWVTDGESISLPQE